MKAVFGILICFGLIEAASLRYEVRAGLFGLLDVVDIHYRVGAHSYDIKGESRTYGLAKTMSGNRVEQYHSKGSVKNGRYYSSRFDLNIRYKEKKVVTHYHIDYKKKKIIKKWKKWKKGKMYENKTEILKYFSSNDLITLYHNVVHKLYKTKKPGRYHFKAAGVEGYGGDVFAIVPPAKQQIKEAKDMDAPGTWIVHIITRKRLLRSKRGELVFAVDKHGIAKAVRLLDVPMAGSLTAKRVR